LKNQFKKLANEILEDKFKRFTEQNAASLDALLKPLQTKLTEFKEQVSTSLAMRLVSAMPSKAKSNA